MPLPHFSQTGCCGRNQVTFPRCPGRLPLALVLPWARWARAGSAPSAALGLGFAGWRRRDGGGNGPKKSRILTWVNFTTDSGVGRSSARCLRNNFYWLLKFIYFIGSFSKVLVQSPRLSHRGWFFLSNSSFPPLRSFVSRKAIGKWQKKLINFPYYFLAWILS